MDDDAGWFLLGVSLPAAVEGDVEPVPALVFVVVATPAGIDSGDGALSLSLRGRIS